MLSTALLRLLRYTLYLAAIFLALLEFIVDAVALAALNQRINGFRIDFSAHKGAAGYTMFVTLATLLFLPVVTFANILANRGFGAAAKLNRIGHELAVAGLFTALWFIAGVVMAVYAGEGDCFGFSVCKKFKAATAFAWFPFFVFALQTGVLVLILQRIRSSGGTLQTPAHQIDDEAQAAAPPQHVEQPFERAHKAEESYYNSNPEVAMPAGPA
ncbi:hypothetical protein H4S02_009251 [Coemansia sp. RSA 2611]|nr:hypothetical protein IWW51_004426 [Coemansia sp. RSA 2702]KAJ2372318.1 hypothetical protein H4S02_009251 [Coemansia sp. RSA 2611]KAJ2716352.1 hypothetical protein H4R23_005462 [Coemansia sp. Cherry 401B]